MNQNYPTNIKVAKFSRNKNSNSDLIAKSHPYKRQNNQPTSKKGHILDVAQISVQLKMDVNKKLEIFTHVEGGEMVSKLQQKLIPKTDEFQIWRPDKSEIANKKIVIKL